MAATVTQAPVEEILYAVFSVRSGQECYKQDDLLLELVCLASQLRVAVAEGRERFGNPDERERLALEAGTRRLVQTVSETTSLCVIVY
jgi:hypothetical protein